MDLWIYDENFKLQGIVDTASSVLWVNRYRECGDFEIYIQASKEMLDLLQLDRYVVRPDDSMACIIEKIQITTDEEQGDYMTVSGRCLRSILDRRIVWKQTVLNDTVENCMRQLITDAFITPEIEDRKFEGLTLAPAHGYTETITTQYTGDNLLDVIMELCASNDYGFKIALQDSGMVVDFYKPTDRSTAQGAVPRVIFSEDMDTLSASDMLQDKTNYKNCACVGGEGEGTARKYVTVSRKTMGTGLQRREVFVDAKDVSTNEGEITLEEYGYQLAERGITQLRELPIVRSMTGGTFSQGPYTYGTDYNLGDIVTTINKYGVAVDSHVLEIMEKWDDAGYELTPTFG